MKRITSQAEFDELKINGIRKRSRYFDLVFCACNHSGDFGLAVIVSKKIAHAVKRNKIKRWIKNFAHSHSSLFSKNKNFLVISKKGIFEFGRENIYKDMEKVLENLE